MNKIIITAILLMFVCVAVSFAGDSEESELPVEITTDQYTQYQQDDRREVNLAIYQYYNDPDSHGNVPIIEGDTREYTSPIHNQGPVNLNPAVKLSPF